MIPMANLHLYLRLFDIPTDQARAKAKPCFSILYTRISILNFNLVTYVMRKIEILDVFNPN